MNTVDLTHLFTANMPVFPGDNFPSLKESIDKENDIVHFSVSTGMHIGTHMDGPLHMIPTGRKLSEISPDRFIANGHLIDARGLKEVKAGLLEKHTIVEGDCVLIYPSNPLLQL